MTSRSRLFELRAALETDALDLMVRKNKDYSSSGAALENYVDAARKAKTSPALYIVGRVEEKLTRLSNILSAGQAAVANEGVRQELIDLVNFPSLILAAMEEP